MKEQPIDPNIIRWLTEARDGMDATLRGAAPHLYLQHTQAVETAALDSAICSHLEWRDRLEKLFDLDSELSLEEGIVARNDFCPLGRWLTEAAAGSLAGNPDFDQLRAAHAEFHQYIGKIIRASRAGDKLRARQILAGKEYINLSWKVVESIAKLARALENPA